MDLGVLSDERRVLVGDHRDLEGQALRILEAKAGVGALRWDVLSGEPLLPEVERLVGGDAEDDPVHHSRACAPGACVRVLEERQVAACTPLLVGVEEVVDGRVILVHGLLDEPQAEDANVEVDVAGRRP